MTSETLRKMLVKQEPRNICCYVCAGPKAECPLFSKPYGNRPFFPFFEHHNIPDGAEPITADGRVLVCNLCYVILTQQWNAFEKSRTPQNKRIYWLKRLDNGAFAGMDVNLQQDYESLFDASHSSMDSESRPKQRSSRNTHTPEARKTPKFPVRSESRDSSVSSLSSRCEKGETPDICVNNVLDLTMPSRTPSHSSTPGAELESCYVCGIHSQNLLNVFAKPIANCPFFPSLMLHCKPLGAKPMEDSGKVHVCDSCHKNLLLQWDAYQRQNVPHASRSYVFNTSSTAVPVMKQEGMPSHDKMFVCFTCGMAGQISIKREISSYPEKEGDQYFSFLARIPPCPGAEPLINGRASVCSLCYKGFLRQLRVFELSGIPEEQRKYKIHSDTATEDFSVLRQQLKGGAHNAIKHCYLCDKSSDSLFPISTLPNSPMYFSFIQTLNKTVCAKTLGEDGMTEVCKECFVSLKFQWEAFENAKIPNSQRQYRITNPKVDGPKRNITAHPHNVENQSASSFVAANCVLKIPTSESCCLCTRHLTQETMQILETLPTNDHMYFPFIRNFLKAERQSYIDTSGRVLVCQECYVFLKNQWDFFESARVPHSQRQYRVLLSVPDHHEMKTEPIDTAYFPNESSSTPVNMSSPDIKADVNKLGNKAEPLLMTLSALSSERASVSSSHSPQLDSKTTMPKSVTQPVAEDTVRPITGPFDAPLGRPLLLNSVCFVCAEYSTSTPMYCINSQPLDNNPFFPFLSKRSTPDGAEKLSPEGCALVCMFCYHSLISQYLAYDASPYSEDMNPWQRAYNTYNYVCYVCGITTYRQRACSISVRDFPFVAEHPRPMGALVLLGGECVVTCLTCFESLTTQWKDFERMKVPLGMRKYNWIVFPAPPDDEKSHGCQILPGHEVGESGKVNSRTSPKEAAASEDLGLPHGSKPPPPHVPVQSIYSTKPTSRAIAAVSPSVHQNAQHGSSAAHSSYENSSSSSALNATRTSSFAAALRKLAKQAVDPIPERERSPICSPVPNQHSLGSKSVGSTNPAYSSSHIPVATMPVVSASPSHVAYELDKRKEYIRYSSSAVGGSSRATEPLNFKSDYPKHMNSHEDQRSDSNFEAKQAPLYTSLSQYSSREEHNSLSHGFQPYRNAEEPAPGTPMYEHSPPTSSSLYSYHRPVYQITNASQNYRLEDSVYLERYGMLRPPAVPFPPSTIPYPGMPFYPSNRYPPGLLAQPSPLAPTHGPAVKTERARSEERFSENDLRVRESYESGHHMFQSRERGARETESNDVSPEDKVRRIYSPLSLQINSRTESPVNTQGRMEPIPYGSSHEMLLLKQSPPSSSSAPLNLVKQTPSVSPYPEEMGKWKIKQHYASNGQNYSGSSGPSHIKSSYENSVEQKFHPPPPLISEVPQEQQVHRNSFKMDDPGNRNLLAYSKRVSPYLSREFQRPPDESVYSRTVVSSQHNGRDVYDSHTVYDSEKSRRDFSSRTIAEDSSVKIKPQVKNGALPIPDSWASRNYYPVDRLRQADEVGKNSAVPASSSYSAGSMQPSHFTVKDASITRALLQNQITPSIIEKYVHASEEMVPRIMSKLDLREAKLRQLRAATGDPDRELSDSESDDDGGARKLKEFLVITKGPPLEFKASPQKLGFFKNVGLTTQPKKQYLEWRKYMKRRRMLREKSCSPIIEVSQETAEYDQNHIAELTKRLSFEDDSDTKRDFLKLFGLVKVSPVKQEPGTSEPMDVSSSVPESGQKDFASTLIEKPANEVPETHFKKRFSMLTRMHMESLSKASLPNHAVMNCVAANESSSATTSLTVPSLKPVDASQFSTVSKVVSKSVPVGIPPLIRTEHSLPERTQSGKSVLVSQDPRVKLLDRSFAQEFHESVLQATQMQLGQKAVTPNKTPEMALSRTLSLDSSHSIEEPPRPTFSWPGIEAIMEAYESHLSEQSVEKEFLIERLHHLNCQNQELTGQITCLGQKTSELAQRKSHLDTENASLQAALDNFKSFFIKFR